MRTLLLSLVVIAAPTALLAQAPAPAAAAAPQHYTTAETPLGALLDDQKAKAVVDKDLPGLTADPRIDMARGMTLRALEPFSKGLITDAMLDKVDTDLAALSADK